MLRKRKKNKEIIYYFCLPVWNDILFHFMEYEFQTKKIKPVMIHNNNYNILLVL